MILGLEDTSTEARAARTARDLLRHARREIELLNGRAYTADLDRVATRAVIAEAKDIWLKRQRRRADRIESEAARHPATTWVANQIQIRDRRRAQRLKLERLRCQELLSELIEDNYRAPSGRWAGGEMSVRVAFGTAHAETHLQRVRSRNGKWSGNNCDHRLTVPATWRRRVHSRGLAVLDDLVTLDATVALREDQVTVYAAVWVVQSRLMLSEVRGWIATNGEHHYHTEKSAKAAAVGLGRKLAAIQAEIRQATLNERQARLDASMRYRLEHLDLAGIEDVVVSLTHSQDAGNCLPGSIALRDRLFDDDRREATIGEIFETGQAAGFLTESWLQGPTGRALVLTCLVALRAVRSEMRLCVPA